MGYQKRQEKEKVAHYGSGLPENDPVFAGKGSKNHSKKSTRKKKRESNMTTRDYLVSLIE